MIREGSQAPDFELASDSGERVRLSALRGRPVVLYFYPKDDTPGCTKQACGFRDEYSRFEERGAVVLGVSPDSEASHLRFKSKHNLPFTLLADPDHEVAEAYGAWGEKSMYGKRYQGVIRSAYLVDEDGTVAGAWPKVSPKDTATNLLQALAR